MDASGARGAKGPGRHPAAPGRSAPLDLALGQLRRSTIIASP
jgi:hypothetical protein